MIGSLLKRAYETVSMFALFNLLALGGLIGYSVTTGVVDAEQLRRIGAVLRREDDGASSMASEEEQNQEPKEAVAAKRAMTVPEAQMELEIIRREAERVEEELRQRLALNNSILLKVTAERERFNREQEDGLRRDEAAKKDRQRTGFQKQIAIYEGLASKIALQHLLGLNDSAEAAEILLAMTTGKAKKIVEAAKKGNDLSAMQTILKRVREAAPQRSSAMNGGGRDDG